MNGNIDTDGLRTAIASARVEEEAAFTRYRNDTSNELSIEQDYSDAMYRLRDLEEKYMVATNFQDFDF